MMCDVLSISQTLYARYITDALYARCITEALCARYITGCPEDSTSAMDMQAQRSTYGGVPAGDEPCCTRDYAVRNSNIDNLLLGQMDFTNILHHLQV